MWNIVIAQQVGNRVVNHREEESKTPNQHVLKYWEEYYSTAPAKAVVVNVFRTYDE